MVINRPLRYTSALVVMVACFSAPAAAEEYSRHWPEQRDYGDAALNAAMEAMRAGIPGAARDPTQPSFHFRPPARWMNDVCGAIHYRGYYHVFYQLNPFSAEPGWHSSETSTWGHARSKDLVHWEHLPIALVAVKELGQLRSNSGCVALDENGTPTIFYTYVPRGGYVPPPELGWIPGDRQQWIAKSHDGMVTWKRSEQNPVVDRRASGIPSSFDRYKGWSDPFLFRLGDRTLVTFKSCGGLVCEAQNAEYTRWKYAGTLRGVEGECPNLIEVDGRWLMVTSGGGGSRQLHYKVGTLDAERLDFEVQTQGVMDHAYGPAWLNGANRGFYGTSLMEDPQGRVLIFGWAGGYRAGRAWNSCMGVPRAITLGPDGRPRQRPVDELKALRGDHTRLENLVLDDQSRLLSGAGDALELAAEFRLGTASTCGLKIRRSADGRHGVSITCDGKMLDVAGTRVPLAPEDQDQTLKLHVFVDKVLLEVFVNDGAEVITREIDARSGDDDAELFAEGGTATIKRLDLWQMKSIW